MSLLNAILTWNTGRLWVSSENIHFTINTCPMLFTNCVSPCENQTGMAVVMIISHKTPSDLQRLTSLIFSILNILSKILDLQQSVDFRSVGNTPDGMNDCQKSVQWHQHECIYRSVTRHHNHVLNLYIIKREEKKQLRVIIVLSFTNSHSQIGTWTRRMATIRECNRLRWKERLRIRFSLYLATNFRLFVHTEDYKQQISNR